MNQDQVMMSGADNGSMQFWVHGEGEGRSRREKDKGEGEENARTV